jgi:type III secretory pathway component EscV
MMAPMLALKARIDDQRVDQRELLFAEIAETVVRAAEAAVVAAAAVVAVGIIAGAAAAAVVMATVVAMPIEALVVPKPWRPSYPGIE